MTNKQKFRIYANLTLMRGIPNIPPIIFIAHTSNGQISSAVNQKAKMFVDIANKDPEKEKAERERKLEFEKKKLGFQEGSVPCNNNTKV